MNDGKEFPVIDIVVSLSWPEQLGKVRAWMPIYIGIHLQENATRCIFGDICGNGEGFQGVREVNNGLSQETILQFVEGILTRIAPDPRGILLGEIEKGAGDVRIVPNEFSIEVGKSEERMDIFDLSWHGPIYNPIELSGIHFDVSRG